VDRKGEQEVLATWSGWTRRPQYVLGNNHVLAIASGKLTRVALGGTHTPTEAGTTILHTDAEPESLARVPGALTVTEAAAQRVK